MLAPAITAILPDTDPCFVKGLARMGPRGGWGDTAAETYQYAQK